MSDRDDEKIISLDQRRRAEQARQKAEIEAAARRKRTNGQGNGSAGGFNRPFGEPVRTRAANAPGGFARGVGGLVAWIVWGGLAAMLVLAVYGWIANPAAG